MGRRKARNNGLFDSNMSAAAKRVAPRVDALAHELSTWDFRRGPIPDIPERVQKFCADPEGAAAVVDYLRSIAAIRLNEENKVEGPWQRDARQYRHAMKQRLDEVYKTLSSSVARANRREPEMYEVRDNGLIPTFVATLAIAGVAGIGWQWWQKRKAANRQAELQSKLQIAAAPGGLDLNMSKLDLIPTVEDIEQMAKDTVANLKL